MKPIYTFQPFTIKDMTLKNRIVMPPMCMYSSDAQGVLTDFHFTHYTSRALGGVGLIIVEATGVMPNGRISDTDLGLWNEEQKVAMADLVRQVKHFGSKIGIQLNHGGRKYEGEEKLVAPSALAFDADSKTPAELSLDEIQEIITAFQTSARFAYEAGFDLLEIHGAHGYLVNQFLSPISNQRTDAYGGNLVNRTRFLKEVIAAIKAVWPVEKPLCLRISATEHLDEGYDINDMITMLTPLVHDLDLIHVSTGGNGPWRIQAFPGYQLREAERIREQLGKPTIAVGLIDDIHLIEEVLGHKRTDLVAVGRELLNDPYFVIHQAVKYGVNVDLPLQYERGFKK